MIITPIQITSINMRRMNFLLPVFLQSTTASIVLVQEVWFGRISTLCSDTDPDGVTVYGPPKHDDWDCILPQYSGDEKCQVACYVRKSISMSPDVLIFPRLDHPIASRDSQVIEVTISGTVFLLVNIYHAVRNHKPSLSHILPNPLDSFTPTLVVGDFNTHSSTWSLPGATVSSWAAPLEEWFEESDLLLANPAGAATRKGTRSENRTERDSVIDLFLLNDSALCTGRFSPISISFEDSLGLDHAAISIFWSPPLEPTPYSPTTLPGFVIDDTLKDEWIKDFSYLPTPTISSLPSLTAAADALDTDIYAISGRFFKRRRTPDFRGLRWWNVHCEAALTCVASTRGKSRDPAIRDLRQTIREAKRCWARDPGTPPICKWTQETLQVPPDSTPADLVLGALKLKQRRVFCACLQVFFKHCFSGSFSLRFRPTAGDTIMCPCGDTPFESGMAPHPSHDDPIGAVPHADPPPDPGPEDGFLTPPKSGPVFRPSRVTSTLADGDEGWRADPSPGFRRLMEEFLHPSSGREASVRPVQPLHMGREASVHPGPLRKIHSPEHVLLECPLTEPYRHLIRDSILGSVNVRNLFYTIKGAESLATFLLRSNSLLRPLPPRPDPP